MNRYSEYKESGIDWIGDIPEHWSVSRLDFLMTVNGRVGWKALKADEYVDNGYIFLATPNIKGINIDFKNVNYITEERFLESPEIILEIGDVLLTKDGSTLGTTNFVKDLPSPATVNSSIAVLKKISSLIECEYIYLFFQSYYVQNIIQLIKGGMGVPHLFQADIKKFTILLPSLQEQKQIAKYLDKKLSQIDSLIKKTQRKVDLLKEQQTATINHYVTKGLDPSVKMKDSGIEWIGEIPEHWNLTKLKYLVDIVAGRDPSSIYDDDGEYDVLGTGGVIGKTNEFMCNQTSLILGRKGTIDKPFIQKIPFWISDVVYYILPTSYISPNYFWFLFSQIDFSFYKYGSTMPSMSRDEYENMKFPIPPKEDITEIEQTLNFHFETSSKLIIKNEKRIELLKEYRQSLISNVVTGKVRVTEEVI